MHLTRPARTVRLTVRDTGPGMDEATLSRVFEPFFTTQPMGEGTGLGLSVVRGIIHAHEGAIVVASEPTKGTSFTIYLPIAEEQVKAPFKDARGDTSKLPLIGGGGVRLLYIDDDESMVYLVVRLLKRRNYIVSGISDASAAIEKLRGDPSAFDVVVSDYNMPYLSGLDVARAVRDIRADLPVAIVSGFIDERLLAQAKDAGVRELIVKTVDVTDFCESVQRLAESVSK
jgi:CheY-like chemotaxis protein